MRETLMYFLTFLFFNIKFILGRAEFFEFSGDFVIDNVEISNCYVTNQPKTQ